MIFTMDKNEQFVRNHERSVFHIPDFVRHELVPVERMGFSMMIMSPKDSIMDEFK